MNGKAWARANLFRRPESNDPTDTAVAAWLAEVRTGIAQQVDGLELVPLVRPTDLARSELTLGEAIERELLEIAEQEQARVNEIEATNRGREPVLIVEGETLVGCKQNRVVAHSVIVPAGGTVKIPVGCMEQGRWRHVSRRFRSGTLKMDPKFRSSTMREAHRSRRSAGAGPKLDQRRLWKDVEGHMAAYASRSPTADYEHVVRERSEKSRRQAAAITPVRDQIGVVATWQGQLLGIELAGHPATWKALSARTLGSYVFAIPVIERSEPAGRRLSSEEWLASLAAARTETHPALGLGTDLELSGPGFTGAGIWLAETPAFVAAFPTQ